MEGNGEAPTAAIVWEVLDAAAGRCGDCGSLAVERPRLVQAVGFAVADPSAVPAMREAAGRIREPVDLYPVVGVVAVVEDVRRRAYDPEVQPIRMREFVAGVTWWRTETNWPADFHNRDYLVLAAENLSGRFDAVWWAKVQPRLTRWNAFRPTPRSVVAANVVAQADALAQAWKISCEPYRDADIAAAEVSWEAVRAFPDVVATLKPTLSPVFPSKLCHFVLPRVFPVVDGLALGGHSYTYERYFNEVKGTWQLTDLETREALIAEMTRLVEQLDRPLDQAFPLVTKIVELALIGRRHPDRAALSL